MCVVLDASAYGDIFNSKSIEHHKFKPVMDWVENDRATFVYGGETYLDQLTKAGYNYVKLFRLLKDKKKARELPKDEVDREEINIKNSKWMKGDFDDAHLAAIIIVSKSKIICLKDTRAIKHLKNHNLYKGKGVPVPKLYLNESRVDLLCDRNLCKCCDS